MRLSKASLRRLKKGRPTYLPSNSQSQQGSVPSSLPTPTLDPHSEASTLNDDAFLTPQLLFSPVYTDDPVPDPTYMSASPVTARTPTYIPILSSQPNQFPQRSPHAFGPTVNIEAPSKTPTSSLDASPTPPSPSLPDHTDDPAHAPSYMSVNHVDVYTTTYMPVISYPLSLHFDMRTTDSEVAAAPSPPGAVNSPSPSFK